jgi:SAM-dependent methyltransferase
MAESFGVDAERYDRTRQPYPDALIARVAAASPGPNVLDVGCGTGIAARQFQAVGCTVLGVEPDERMAEVARRTGVTVEVARFEGWDPAGRTFDAVVAGTAWHWVDPAAGAARAAAVLKPGGRFAALWHTFDLPPTIGEGFATAFRQAVPEAPATIQANTQALAQYQALLDKAADGLRANASFGEPEQWRVDWQRTYTRDEWLDQLPTSGAFTRLPKERVAQLLAGVGAAIDDLGGSFTLPYATVAVTAERVG